MRRNPYCICLDSDYDTYAVSEKLNHFILHIFNPDEIPESEEYILTVSASSPALDYVAFRRSKNLIFTRWISVETKDQILKEI